MVDEGNFQTLHDVGSPERAFSYMWLVLLMLNPSHHCDLVSERERFTDWY